MSQVESKVGKPVVHKKKEESVSSKKGPSLGDNVAKKMRALLEERTSLKADNIIKQNTNMQQKVSV